MPSIVTGAEYVTFVNSFRCRAEDQDEIVRINVEIVDQVAAVHAGFISASIHRSVDGTRVVNYLQWRTADDLARMQSSESFRALGRQFAGITEFDPHQCEVVHVREVVTPS